MFNKLKENKPLFFALIAVLIVLLVVIIFIIHICQEANEVEQASTGFIIKVSAMEDSGHGIATDSSFRVDCSEGLSEDQVREKIEVSPDLDYTLEKQTDEQYTLQFNEELSSDTIVTFIQKGNLNAYSWAFQTENVFKVTSTLPADKEQHVPVDSGIEIELSYLDLTNFEDSFSIEPETPGRFEQHGKTWVFVPDSVLSTDTLYTVTVAGGLKSSKGEVLGNNYSFSFRTDEKAANDRSYLYIYGDNVEAFTPDIAPYIEVRASDEYNNTDFKVSVYQYNGADNYKNVLKDRYDYLTSQLGYEENYLAATDGLSLVTDFQTKIERTNPDETWSSAYIVLPGTLAEGYYLVDIQAIDNPAASNGRLQKLIQINRNSVYSISVDGSELVWVIDSTNGQPVSKVKVDISGISGETAADGTVRIDTPEIDGRTFNLMTVSGEVVPFIAALDIAGTDQSNQADQEFYSYLYTDRSKYQPTDTIRVWGVIISKSDAEQPEKANLVLMDGYGEGVLYQTEVSLDAKGSFSGEINISGLKADYYKLELSSGDLTFNSRYIDVGQYTKPAYIIESNVDQPIYFGWQDINLSADVSFFDGTPAGDTPFNIFFSGDRDNDITVKSDSDGVINQTLHYQDDDDDSWYPEFLYYYISTSGAEDYLSETSGSCIVIPRDTMIDTKVSGEGGNYSLQVKTNSIDISGIKDPDDISEAIYDGNYDKIRGDSSDIALGLKIYQVTWNKVQTGTYYDFINKKAVPKYSYDRSESLVEERTGQTVNGATVFSGLNYQNTRETYYYGVIDCKDSRGQKISQRVYLYDQGFYYPEVSNIKYYRFSHEDSKMIADNETVTIDLMENEQRTESQGKLLYFVMQDGLENYQIVSAPSFDYKFSEADIPNILIAGAYFDGKHIYPVSSDFIAYDPSARQLNVEVTANQESYSPGDDVEISLKVTDMDNHPVKGASLLVSVVDEAAFAVSGQTADPLGDIYSRYFYPQYYTYTSYVQHDFSGSDMAEGGGEGESAGIRKNFLDTAAFLTAESDRNGDAVLSFKLPDNLTSWRVTSLAVAEGVSAGDSRINIVTTKPFFADLLINKVFIAGDDISAAARGFGSALKNGDNVDFEAVLTLPDGTTQNLTKAGKAKSYINFNFGTQPEGDYTLTLSAQSDAGMDAVQKSFRVLNSALEIPVAKTFSLTEGIDIQALRSPVTLVFFDNSARLYNECLGDLTSGYGKRADVRISRVVAQDILEEMYGEQLPYYFYGSNTEEIAKGGFQDNSGGVCLFDYAEPDVELTAKLCVASPEYLNTDDAVSYLKGILNNEESQPEDVAAAYLGLAALHEPVLLDIQYLLANEESFGLKEKLYLIAALAYIGDLDSAQAAYQETVTPALIDNDPWTYLNSGDTSDSDIEYTALAALTAMKLANADTEGMMHYVIENASTEYTTCLEQLAYIRLNPVLKESEAAFSYYQNGDLKTEELKNNQVMIKVMTTDQLEAADFSVLKGSVGVWAAYMGSTNDVVKDNTDFVTLEKTVEPVDSSSITQSGLVKITITPTFSGDAPKGWYELSDYIPSGMRYVSCSNNWSYNWWLEDTEGQMINFSVKNLDQNDQKYYKEAPIVYYVRATLSGDFIVDSAYIKDYYTSAWGMSERKEISIGE